MSQVPYYQTAGSTIATSVALSVLTILALGLRFWTRRSHQLPLKADDWLAAVSGVFAIGLAVTLIYGVSQRAFGYPLERADEAAMMAQVTLNAKIQYICEAISTISYGATKLSFLFFYMRVFSVGHHNKRRILLLGFIGLVSIWTVSFFFALIFQCGVNVQSVWSTSSLSLAKCVDTKMLALSFTGTDAVQDVLVMIAPIPMIWRLNLKMVRKLTITGMFLLGGVAVGASWARFVMTVKTVRQPRAHDLTYRATAYLYWAIVESNIGVFAACLPTIVVPLRELTWEKVLSSTRSLLRSQSQGFTSQSDGTSTRSASSDHRRGKLGLNVGQEPLPPTPPQPKQESRSDEAV